MSAYASTRLAPSPRSAEIAALREQVRRLERRLAELERSRPLVRDPLRSLTARERDIAELVGRGRSNHEVACELHLSPKTVEWNLSKVYRKLLVRSRTELAAKLARHGGD